MASLFPATFQPDSSLTKRRLLKNLQRFYRASPFSRSGRRPFPVDIAAHAASIGAATRHVESIADLATALDWAQTTDRTTVISIVTDAFAWVPGDAAWDVGVSEVSEQVEVRAAPKDHEAIRARQRVGV